MTRYLVATIRPWNLDAYRARAPALPGDWELVETPDALFERVMDGEAPRYVFFPHWSWRVPDKVLDAAECVCFHMTDVPYGRGSSPLQNLIRHGHRETVLTALRMTDELDAGPVYMKRPLSLAGRAQEIYERAAALAFDMIADIVATDSEPLPQTGVAVIFTRRTPEQSQVPADIGLQALYDHIRMLDAETYPPAFMDYDGLRLEFTHAEMKQDGVAAAVTFRRRDES